MRPRWLAALLLLPVLARAVPASAQVTVQLPFPLEEMLPRVLEASGGERGWSAIRDIALFETRRQLGPGGKTRASEDLEIYFQIVPHLNLLIVRKSAAGTIREGWHRGAPWMLENGLRVHDRARLESARTELLATLFLERLPFDLPEEITGPLTYEGEFGLDGRRIHRLRYRSGEYPGGDVRLYVDAESFALYGLGWFDRSGAWTEVVFSRWFEEHGIRTPWIRDFRTGGAVRRRDQVRNVRVNQWISPDAFRAETWLQRPTLRRSASRAAR